MTSSVAATIYCRISDDTRGEGLGVERQEKECRALCERLGFEVREVIVDNDMSATTGKVRPGFERLLKSEPEAIVCWHTDRLVRITKDLERVIDLGVNVYAVQAGHLDLSNPAGRAVARTVTAWATYEGEQKAERQKAAHRQRVEKGLPWWPSRPFGFHKDTTHHPVEAPLLAEAYKKIAAGASLYSVVREWNQRGVTTPKGNQWRSANLRSILTNPRNAAIATYNGQEVGKASWEPITDEVTFRAVVRILNQPGRKPNDSSRRTGLLTGLIQCECSGRMRVASQKHRGKTYKYYRCERQDNSWPQDALDERVREALIYALDNSDVATLTGSENAAEDAAALSAEADRLREVIEGLLEDRIAGVLTREQWQRAHDKATEQLREVEQRMESVGQAASIPAWALDAGNVREHLLSRANEDEIRALIGKVFGRILVGKRGRGAGRGDLPWQRLNAERNATALRFRFTLLDAYDEETGMPLSAERVLQGAVIETRTRGRSLG